MLHSPKLGHWFDYVFLGLSGSQKHLRKEAYAAQLSFLNVIFSASWRFFCVKLCDWNDVYTLEWNNYPFDDKITSVCRYTLLDTDLCHYSLCRFLKVRLRSFTDRQTFVLVEEFSQLTHAAPVWESAIWRNASEHDNSCNRGGGGSWEVSWSFTFRPYAILFGSNII